MPLGGAKNTVGERDREQKKIGAPRSPGGREMNPSTPAEKVDKNVAVHQAIEDALKYLEEHDGQEGFRHWYDKAIHVLVAIDQAGFRIARKPSKR